MALFFRLGLAGLLLLLTGGLWLAPLYFRLEADAVYMILVIVGYISVWAIRSSGAYGMDREHRAYKWKDRKGKKLRIWYMQDAKTMLQGMAACLVVGGLVFFIVNKIRAGKSVSAEVGNEGQTGSQTENIDK